MPLLYRLSLRQQQKQSNLIIKDYPVPRFKPRDFFLLDKNVAINIIITNGPIAQLVRALDS